MYITFYITRAVNGSKLFNMHENEYIFSCFHKLVVKYPLFLHSWIQCSFPTGSYSGTLSNGTELHFQNCMQTWCKNASKVPVIDCINSTPNIFSVSRHCFQVLAILYLLQKLCLTDYCTHPSATEINVMCLLHLQHKNCSKSWFRGTEW